MPEKTSTKPAPPVPSAPMAPAATTPTIMEIPISSIGDLAQKLYSITQPNGIGRSTVRVANNNNEPILVLVARGPIACSGIDQIVDEVARRVQKMLTKAHK